VIRYITPEVNGTDYAMVVRGANCTNSFVSVAEPDGDFTSSGIALFEEITAAPMTALAEGTANGFEYVG